MKILSLQELTLTEWACRLLTGRPHFVVRSETGDPNLYRWWIIPRNRFLNIYLHKIVGSDTRGDLHDHPWDNVTIVLWGKYLEHTEGETWTMRKFLNFVFRKKNTKHKIELIEGKHAWTLFLTGPERTDRPWGFWSGSKFIPHTEKQKG